MCEGGDPLLLVRLKPKVDCYGDKSDSDENDTNQVAQWQATDEPQRQEHRNPNDDLAQIRLQENEQARCSRDRSRKQQPQHWMHFAKLSQKYRQNHNPGDNGKLRGLEINWAQMQPATRPINFGADKLRQDEKNDAC
jgi:hypothetical protein